MDNRTYFVPTDADGGQHVGDDVTSWPLPSVADDGRVIPGEEIEPEMGAPLVLRDLDGLLEDLGERIFLAEIVGEGAGERARLREETAWSLHAAARFALDCAEHALVGADDLGLPSGTSLKEVVGSARSFLDEDEKTKDGLLQKMSRLALARRLRRLGSEVADVALVLTAEDERADLDAIDDPRWSTVAAIREAVLSAVEAIRHDAFPRLLEGENRRYEADALAVDEPPDVISTPWGEFTLGNRAGVVPAWVAARDAAARAREATADSKGAEAGEAERRWQRDRLAAALGIGPSEDGAAAR